MKDQKKSHLAVLFVTVFLYLVGFGLIIPILPVLSREYGASALEVGLLMSLFSFMQFVFAPFWGAISDRWGRRPVILGCLIGEAVAYALFAFTSSLWGLFAVRAMAGFFGASLSTASASISDVTGPQERSKGMALIGAAFGLGFIIGPALGGGLTHLGEVVWGSTQAGVQLSVLFVSALCLVTFTFGYFKLNESLQPENRNKGNRPSRFVQMKKMFEIPPFSVLVVTFFLATFSMSAMEATLILFVGDKFQWGLKEVSFGFAYIGVLSTLNQGFLVRKLLPRLGERRLLSVGLVLMALSFSLIANSNSIELLAVAMTVLSFGTAFTNPSILGSISLLIPADQQGEALGTAQSSSSLGRILGPAVGGFLYGSVSMIAPFVCATLVTLSGFLLIQKYWKQLPNSALTRGG